MYIYVCLCWKEGFLVDFSTFPLKTAATHHTGSDKTAYNSSATHKHIESACGNPAEHIKCNVGEGTLSQNKV